MRLKSWESPRKEGRNNKGRGGSARQRQLKKRQQMLRKRLKEDNKIDSQDKNNNNSGGKVFSPSFFWLYCQKTKTIFLPVRVIQEINDP